MKEEGVWTENPNLHEITMIDESFFCVHFGASGDMYQDDLTGVKRKFLT